MQKVKRREKQKKKRTTATEMMNHLTAFQLNEKDDFRVAAKHFEKMFDPIDFGTRKSPLQICTRKNFITKAP